MSAGLASLATDITEAILTEPQMLEMLQKIRELSEGSPFQQAALEYYFSSELKHALLEQPLDTTQDETYIDLSMKELQPELTTLSREDLKALAIERNNQIRTLANEYATRALDLMSQLCYEAYKQAMTQVESSLTQYDKAFDSKIDYMITDKLEQMPESTAKVILESLHANHEVRLSDLEAYFQKTKKQTTQPEPEGPIEKLRKEYIS